MLLGVLLPAGWLVYTGSARRGLDARVARHLRRRKPLHWYVDVLTSHPLVTVAAAWLYPDVGGAVTECALNRATAALPGASLPAPGFGASDCRARCPAHLLGFAVRPVLPPALPFRRVERTGPPGG